MKQKRFNVEQIAAVLEQTEAGVPLAEMKRRQFLQNCALAPALLTAQGAYSLPTAQTDRMVIKNSAGLRWEFERTSKGWALGCILLNDEPVGEPIKSGMLFLRNMNSGQERWLFASRAEQVDEKKAHFIGEDQVDGISCLFEMDIVLANESPAADVRTRWSVSKDLDGWEVCLAFQNTNSTDWRCTLYPFAGNSTALRRQKLNYVGVPAALLFRRDLSLVALFGISPASDYLNPTTWTRATGFHFRDRAVVPQYRVGGGKLSGGLKYELPLQLVLSGAGESIAAIKSLVRDWITINDYRVEPLFVRTAEEALALFIDGRRTTSLWNPGVGYQICDDWKVVYTAESPISAWFDYLVYEQSAQDFWRKRAFEQVDFMLRAQHLDPDDPDYGVIETDYELDNKVFNSKDHSPNVGYRIDMNAFAARYMFKLWQKVKDREGIDRRDWYQAAARIADWIVLQQNSDGGLPQVASGATGTRSVSVVSGRALVAIPEIYRITGDERYAKVAQDIERFLRERVEGQYWFTGQHPDLWPADYEADSVWCAVEYRLNKYDRTGDKQDLARAEADAYFAFLMLCPKQLSWVRNPTQTCHTEQEHYLQYSNYCYCNQKIRCLERLGAHTGDALFTQLADRIMQSCFWAQQAQGLYKGAQFERQADPWLEVSNEYDSKGVLYLTELALDLNLQLLEMGKARAG